MVLKFADKKYTPAKRIKIPKTCIVVTNSPQIKKLSNIAKNGAESSSADD